MLIFLKDIFNYLVLAYLVIASIYYTIRFFVLMILRTIQDSQNKHETEIKISDTILSCFLWPYIMKKDWPDIKIGIQLMIDTYEKREKSK